MPAVRYLVEECKADVNAIDKKAGDSTSILHTNTRGHTPCTAPRRGDSEMILTGFERQKSISWARTLTVADMANGPGTHSAVPRNAETARQPWRDELNRCKVVLKTQKTDSAAVTTQDALLNDAGV
jgi:hypothetical protein